MPDGTVVSMPAHRCWLFAVIDIATRCIIGYSTSQEMNYNQYDVLRAFQNSILPHKKLDFKIPGYSYPANGGFPSLALPETKYALFDMVMLDNAKSHLSKNVRNKALNIINCTLNYGSVATPETRGIIERFFGTLERKGFHRLPMTTDSSIKGIKRSDPEYKAVKYNVTYDDILEIIEQLIIQYNNSPHEALYNNTPLQEMERKIREYGMMPVIASKKEIAEIEKLTYHTEKRKVCGGIKNGKRPYVNYMNAQYRNDLLVSSNIYVGQELTLLINPDDVSTVEAFAEDGTPLGILRANGERGLKSHSIKNRKAINKYAKQNGLDNRTFSTPVTAYEQELERRSPYSKRERTKADILRREEGKPSLLEQERAHKEKPAPVRDIGQFTHLDATNNMPSVEEVQNMTAEQMWEYIKRAGQ
jgi:transposase InsO family protein